MTILEYTPVEDIFDSLIDNFSNKNNENESFVPKMDIYEKENNTVFIEMELAGYKKEDLKITLEENVLSVSGKISAEDSPDRTYYVKERMDNEFVRKINLAEDIDKESIQADFTNGLLTIKLTKIKPKEKNEKIIKVN